MGIEPTKSSYSASPVLKTGRATRRLYASTQHGTGAVGSAPDEWKFDHAGGG
jgi:hypothetical protein